MNFYNWWTFLWAIFSATFGTIYFVSELTLTPYYRFEPGWQGMSIIMFVVYWIHISFLAYDLQNHPFERITKVYVQPVLRDSIHEMLRENRDNQLLNNDSKENKC